MTRPKPALIALCALIPATVRGQTETLTPRQQYAIDSLMTVYRAAQRMPALSVAIGIHGTVVYARAQGLAEIEHQVAATAKTKFRAASTQKAMTATAILQLVAAGRIALDGEIHRYCPDYPGQRSPISIRQLLLHQSGVRGSDNADVFTRDHYATVHDALARFGTDTLRFAPGTAMLYSNYGYVLLACVIEGASGESYDAYLRHAVLEPAGATSTGPVNLYRVEPDRAESYVIRTAETTSSLKGLWTAAHLASSPLDVPFPADVVDPSFEPGAGNYWSTPTDLVRYAMALDAGRFLADSLRTLQLTPQPAPAGSAPRPMGWTTATYGRLSGVQVFGSDWNGSSAIVLLPEKHLAIAIASNINWNMPSALVQGIIDVIAPGGGR